MGNVPEDRPVLLVGNHSGGNVTPDTIVFTLAFYTYFGVERAFYQLAHNLVLASPLRPDTCASYGTVAASPRERPAGARRRRRRARLSGRRLRGAPPARAGDRVDFAGRKGFVRLALEAGVPIVPVVSIGGQETALFLSHGERLARALRLDRPLRLKVMPISLALPWGLNVGDLLGHIPLPAKIISSATTTPGWPTRTAGRRRASRATRSSRARPRWARTARSPSASSTPPAPSTTTSCRRSSARTASATRR